MALRVLTSAEKSTLQNNVRFSNEVQWAIRNFASYWSVSDDTSIGTQIGQVGYKGWFKNHTFGKSFTTPSNTPYGSATSPQDSALLFLVLAKGMVLVDGAVPFDADTVIDYMIAQGKFDELVVGYAAMKTESIPF